MSVMEITKNKKYRIEIVLGYNGKKKIRHIETYYGKKSEAKAREFEENVKTVQVLCKGIRMRANMFLRLLIKLDAMFSPLACQLDQIIATSGTDYNAYTDEEKAVVAGCLSLVKAMKTILDTPILTESGEITKESLDTYNNVQAQLDSAL